MAKLKDILCEYKKIFLIDKENYQEATNFNNEYQVSLKEYANNATLKKVIIYGVTKDTILLSLQKLELGNGFGKTLSGSLGLFQCCDYLLLSVDKDKLLFIFVEMKSSFPNDNDSTFEKRKLEVERQLNGGRCFIAYCNAVIDHFCKTPLSNEAIVYVKGVLISLQPHATPVTTGNKPKKDTDEDKIEKDTDEDIIDYAHIMCGASGASIHFGEILKHISKKNIYRRNV